jgi:RNA polymerase sigma factor (sigma-70 family)
VAKYARRFEDEEVFWCWLKAVAKSAYRDAGRKRQRYANFLKDYALRWLPFSRTIQSPEESALRQALHDSVAELEAEDRALIEAKYLSKLSVRDLAFQAGQTEKSMESRLLRLRRLLRDQTMRKLKLP